MTYGIENAPASVTAPRTPETVSVVIALYLGKSDSLYVINGLIFLQNKVNHTKRRTSRTSVMAKMYASTSPFLKVGSAITTRLASGTCKPRSTKTRPFKTYKMTDHV